MGLWVCCRGGSVAMGVLLECCRGGSMGVFYGWEWSYWCVVGVGLWMCCKGGSMGVL